MAGSSTSQEDTADAGGWWGSWITSAKSKSAEVYSMVKKDLDEIGSAVRSEASHVYSTTSNVIGKTLKLDEPESTANVMKKSISTFIGQVNTVLNPEPDDSDTEVILSTGDTTMLSTYKKEVEALQRLDATFLVPADSPELTAWLAAAEECADGFSGISRAAAARRLRAEPVLNSQYEKLVPSAVTEEMFWERYLFRVALLQDRLAAVARRRSTMSDGVAVDLPPTNDPVLCHLPLQVDLPPITRSPEKSAPPLQETPVKTPSLKGSPLKTPVKESPATSPQKVPSPTHSASDEVDEGVAWEDEDFASDVELTEEQQTLLLQEYEREIASKRQLKNNGAKDQTNNNLDVAKSVEKQTIEEGNKIDNIKKTSVENKTSNGNDITSKDAKSNKIGPKVSANDPKSNKIGPKVSANDAKSNKIGPKVSTNDAKSNKVGPKVSTNYAKSNKIGPKISANDVKSNKYDTKPVKDDSKNTDDIKKGKESKSDVCGNNLVEDYFKDDGRVKDDASSNSDESWEKEFEIEEPSA